MTVGFVTYETPTTPCGGLAAVMGRLPQAVHQQHKGGAFVLTPYHGLIDELYKKTGPFNVIGDFSVYYDGDSLPLRLLGLPHQDRLPTYFVKPLWHPDTPFFGGKTGPYDVARDWILLRDSLLFGASIGGALNLINPNQDTPLLLQDWQAATAALALYGRGPCHLTLHNTYDHWISESDLEHVGINPYRSRGATILERAIPFMQGPITTVSGQFARDISREVLQTHLMAQHLQSLLQGRLLGINNGLFTDLKLPDRIWGALQNNDFGTARDWKQSRKEAFLEAITQFKPSEERPVWGDVRQFDRATPSWSVMAGRDDPLQKGYDVAALAIEEFIKKGGRGNFLFFPIPGKAGLSFLKRLAENYPQHVLVFPFLFKEGFFAALQGADFGLMPSLYEPFGQANEIYLNGAVGIGRATGGIVQQIVPSRTLASYSLATQRIADLWHQEDAAPTGLLYREVDCGDGWLDDWRQLTRASTFSEVDNDPRLGSRLINALFRSMVRELGLALIDAQRIAETDRDQYYRMLRNGIPHVMKSFSWEYAAKEYLQIVSGGPR